MYISKIKKIQNIGNFKDFQGSQYPFKNLTFIFGENTTGKTTLTDIFRSLQENDPEIIKRRKTIPDSNKQQFVELCLSENQNNQSLKFEKDNWLSNTISKNLEIFGTEFIYKNLFTGTEITRGNKENFTKFIIGELGVKLANKIAEDNKKLGDKKRNLNNKLPKYFEFEQDKKKRIKFLKFDISNLKIEDIKTKLLELTNNKNIEENRLKEPAKILSILDISEVRLLNLDLQTILNSTNSILKKDYSDIKDEFLTQLENHIDDNFKQKTEAEDWIKQGFTKFHTHKKCIFCGQPLDSAKNLLDAYNSYFDTAYIDFVSKIEREAKQTINDLKNINFSLKNKFQTQLTNALKYKELIQSQTFQNNLAEFENKLLNLGEEELNKIMRDFLGLVESKFLEKNKKPHQKIEIIDFTKLISKFDTYKNLTEELNELILKLQNEITTLKEKYKDTETIKNSILKLNEEIAKLEYQKIRIEQNDDCVFCVKEKEEIEILENQIKTDEKTLAQDQKEHTDKYFAEINSLFKKFGSHDFTLEKASSNNGHLPVYSIKVKFHEQIISNDQLEKVFSESDRRALALSIFLAKINLKEESEKLKTIIILDDPITSFDDNRVQNFNLHIKDIYNKVSQILIFTHYLNHLTTYYRHTECKPNTFLIKKTNEGTQIDSFDFDNLLKSDYEKYYIKIKNFNDRIIHNIDLSIPRIFIEKCYSPIFSEFIDESIIKKWKSNCNTYNHDPEEPNSTENLRNFLKDMMNELYNF